MTEFGEFVCEGCRSGGVTGGHRYQAHVALKPPVTPPK